MEDQSINKKPNNMLRSKNGTINYFNILGTLAILLSAFLFPTTADAGGGELFQSRCNVCHSVTDEVKIGPGLGGITEKRSQEWLMTWIKDSDAMIKSGDPDAIAIYEEYNKSAMPAFTDLSDADIQGLIDYMADPASFTAGEELAGNEEGAASSNDYTTPLLWGLIVLAILAIYYTNYRRKIKKSLNDGGIFFGPHHIKNYPRIFSIILIVFGLVIMLLIEGLNNNISHINTILFATLPYVAVGIFLVGSIYRYTKKGYKVSSLSTQFLEGKKLFWGSQPFHWGLLVLFFGHLIAFLFPRALIAWNGQPIRLLILEVSSFAFALLALLGLVLLIKRRLTSKTLLVVTNKMDMVVYAVLLTQIVSGLGVAFFVRWGSTWFASVLTPYLRSIFSFTPDIEAVSAAPVWIQLHIVSAFLIIGIIPFTRFMHFLVAPVDYIWRRYQMVIWNWNRSAIRQSTRHNFGKKPRNH